MDYDNEGAVNTVKQVRVLQQMFRVPSVEFLDPGAFVWVDVPLVGDPA